MYRLYFLYGLYALKTLIFFQNICFTLFCCCCCWNRFLVIIFNNFFFHDFIFIWILYLFVWINLHKIFWFLVFVSGLWIDSLGGGRLESREGGACCRTTLQTLNNNFLSDIPLTAIILLYYIFHVFLYISFLFRCCRVRWLGGWLVD